MPKTYFLLGNLNSKSKTDIDFIKNSIRQSFEEMHGRVNLILSPRERLLHIDPRMINELKKAEKTGKFKIKKYKEGKKRYEKIINKMFNYSGFIPENYSYPGIYDLLHPHKYRLKLHVLPITQKMLCYDWRCKLLLNNSNLIHNEELIREYTKIRLERTNTSNTEILSFLNSLKDNNIIILDEINHGLISNFEGDKKIFFPENRVYIPEVIIKDEINNKKLYI